MPSSQNEIEVSNLPPTPAPITGTVTALQGGAWSVAVNNYPAVQPVSQFGAWNINAIQSGAWNVNATQSGAWSVSVSNFPATQPVSGTVTANQGTTPWTVSGTVGSAQSGAWAVAINNFPATQPVSGTVTANQGTTPWTISGTVTANQGTSPWASNIRVVPTDAHSMYADGIYTDNDKSFSVSASINQTSGGADNPLILIRNPVGSGKRMYIRTLSYGIPVANVFGTMKLFANPTITANGAALTIANGQLGSAVASSMLATSLPTIAANGTQLRSTTYGQNSDAIIVDINGRIVVPPGNNLLITGNPASNNRIAALSLTWIEI